MLLDMSIAEVIKEENALGELSAPSGDGQADDAFLLPKTHHDILPPEEIRKRYAHQAWLLHDKNYTAAAKALAVAANTLRYSVMKK